MNFFDVYINSEEDIPTEYRNQINNEANICLSNEYIQGKLGQIITSLDEIFSNKLNYYFGHGTTTDNEIINAILNEGLKVKDPETVRGYMDTLRGLYSTTIPFGFGSENLFKEHKGLLNNWPHKSSKNVVVVSLPSKYTLNPQNTKTGTDYFEAYYIGDEETGYRLRPEFILGVYDANKKIMKINENYYSNLSEEKQKVLFENIEKRYAVSYASYGVKEPQRETFMNESNYKEATLLWYQKQLEKLREYEKLKEERLKSIQNYNIGEFDFDSSNIEWDTWDLEDNPKEKNMNR